jgi:prepilin-type N-terminal cleavage/methylation domain-containing protein
MSFTKVRGRGFTLIEALVTLAIVAVLTMIAIPSLTNWIAVQRVKAVAAELVTDLRFAKGEAIKRNQRVAIEFMNVAGNQSCYSVHTAPVAALSCSCTQGEGFSCDQDNNPALPNFSTLLVELKTVSSPATSNISIRSSRPVEAFLAPNGFPDPALLGLGAFQAEVDGGDQRKLRVTSNAAGRPQICAPHGSTIVGYPECI